VGADGSPSRAGCSVEEQFKGSIFLLDTLPGAGKMTEKLLLVPAAGRSLLLNLMP